MSKWEHEACIECTSRLLLRRGLLPINLHEVTHALDERQLEEAFTNDLVQRSDCNLRNMTIIGKLH